MKIAVDDFGTGYSSLEYLRRFPRRLRQDRPLVRPRASRTRPRTWRSSARSIELGHALGLSVTAEGVETSEQLGNLPTTGCDSAQGFLFSRPVDPAAVERLLSEREPGGRAQNIGVSV